MNILAQSSPWEGIPIGEHLMLAAPAIALVCTMLAIVLCPLVIGRSTRTIATVTVLGVVITFILALRLTGSVADGGVSVLSTQASDGMFIVDNLSAAFQVILIAFLGGVIWLWWIGSAENERNAPEFFVLLLGSALGMILMVSTTNLLMIVIAIELASLPSYAMVGFDKRDKIGAEAALKYVIFGAISLAIMLYGASLLYGLAGSLSMADIALYTLNHLGTGGEGIVLAAGLLCFLAGIAFKISAVPFHFWCPDAFQGAKIEVTTWLSVASKAAGLILLVRLTQVFCSAAEFPVQISLLTPIAWAIGIVAAVTCTVGNFSAYKQTSVKRLLAYSSIAHAGYMMMAAVVLIHPSIAGHQTGVAALLVYIVIYLFMNLGAFGITALVVWDTGSDDLDSFNGLMRRAPWLAIPMVICLMSLVGLPPLAGFMGKWWILVALGSLDATSPSQSWTSLGSLGWYLIVVTALNTLLSLFYYMRVVVKMTLKDDGQPAVRAPIRGVVMVNACAVILLVLFIWAQPLRNAAERFSGNLYIAKVVQSTLPQSAVAANSEVPR